MRKIELLAPAKDLTCGRTAIDHGADAVYIGAPAFSARQAAANSISDIEALAGHAHKFGAKVYLALNTILFDDELEQAGQLIHEAWNAGVDALIIQDLGLLKLDLPPIPLHASTQMHNIDAEHVRFLQEVGFERAILARELDLDAIRQLHAATDIELEAFVHGALCVSYSGRCYLSAQLGGRSANRGECGQPCRLPWDLKQGKKVLQQNRHLLCLKDMDRSNSLAEMLEAGISSFKIEGRLKDEAYVKNVVAHYRFKLDALLEERGDCAPASYGKTTFSFSPDPQKTFCRGTTEYFLHGKDEDVWSPATPKSIGEVIGEVTEVERNTFCLRSHDKKKSRLHAGDGLCFFDGKGELKGLQVIKVLEGHIHVRFSCAGLKPGMQIMRNHDHKFLQSLKGDTAERRLGLQLSFSAVDDGFSLSGLCEDGTRAEVKLEIEKQEAKKAEDATESIRTQLSKLGNSSYYLRELKLDEKAWFLRASELNQLRRDLIEALDAARVYERQERRPALNPAAEYPIKELDYSYNVSNKLAREFYAEHGVTSIEPAFELQPDGQILMTTKHCIRRELDMCGRESLTLENKFGRFELEFDCANCTMRVKKF